MFLGRRTTIRAANTHYNKNDKVIFLHFLCELCGNGGRQLGLCGIPIVNIRLKVGCHAGYEILK